MLALRILLVVVLALGSSCRIETGPGDDGVSGFYHLDRVNDQQLPTWPHSIVVQSSAGALEFVRPGSIELRRDGTFRREHTLIERQNGTVVRMQTTSAGGTYHVSGGDRVELTGELGEAFTGTLTRGRGNTARVLEVDRQGDEGLTYSYILLRDVRFP